MHSKLLAVLPYGIGVIWLPAVAAPPGPAQADAPAPATKYESPFAGYVPYRDEKPASWREVNDEVARAGGHIGILRGAAGPGTAKPAAPARPVTK